MNSSVAQKTEKKTALQKFLDFVEIGGNKLPHPVTLFAMLCVAVAIISAITAAMGIEVTTEIINRATNEMEVQTIKAVSLLNGDGFKYMIENAVSNFTGFAPLGVVLVGMLGIGIAESSGYIGTLLKKVVSITPAKLIVPTVVFLGIMSNMASDAGYVILIPLGALIFMAYGKHPLAGIAAAFAGVSGGFSANLLIGTIDPMLAGLTNEAAHIIDPTVNITPPANYFFMCASTFLITGGSDLQNLSDKEKKAMTAANLTFVAMVVGLVALILMPNSFLRNLEADSFLNSIVDHSPFMNGLIPIVALLFFVPSVVYGKIAGTVKNEKEVASHMSKAMSSMGGYLCLAFVASQFISYFNYTNLGTIIAVTGASILESANIGTIPLLIGFILITAIINLFVGGLTSKWMLLGPIFIPMLYHVNTSLTPDMVAAAYRIADSSTNVISPLMSYAGIILVFIKKYKPEYTLGDMIKLMFPYSIAFMISWTILLISFFMFKIPLGI